MSELETPPTYDNWVEARDASDRITEILAYDGTPNPDDSRIVANYVRALPEPKQERRGLESPPPDWNS